MQIDALTSQLIGRDAMRIGETRISRALKRLSTGLRVNGAVDDPSGRAMSNLLKARLGRLQSAIENAQDGVNYIRAADAALAQIQDMLHRGRDLAVHAANFAVNTNDDLTAMQSEVDELLAAMDQIALMSTFNGKSLLNGGSGKEFLFDSQADWQGGTMAPANSLDYNSSPGDVKLEPIPWNLRPEWMNPIGDINQNALSLYLTGYTDNGDGTADVQVTIQSEATIANQTYRGYLTLDPSVAGLGPVTVTNLNGSTAAWDGANNRVDFNGANRIRGDAAATGAVRVDFTVDKTLVRWTAQLDQPSGTTTRFYYGNSLLRNELPSYSVGSFFTDMTATGTWTSPTIDTANTAGGTAALKWNVNTAPGSSVTVRLYESPDGAAWTALPLVENGDEFDYTQRYLRVESILTSSGIAYGSPVLEDIEIQLYQGSIIQVGEDNRDDHRLSMPILNGTAAALGIQDIDITSATKAIRIYDTQSDWFSGIATDDGHIDALSRSGFVRLTSPISSTPAPVAQVGGRNMYLTIDSAFQNSDGTFDVTMSLKCYGQVAPNGPIGWIGDINISNGDGSKVQFTSVRNISAEVPAGPPAWPIPPGGAGDTQDINYVDDVTINGADGLADRYVYDAGNPTDGGITGLFDQIFFDYGTTGAQDGVQFSFTADPDALITVDYDTVRLGNAGSGNHDHIAERDSDIYFQDQQVADDIDGVPGNFVFTRRLQEYGTDPPGAPPNPPTGNFTTAAFFFGGGETGSLEGTGLANGAGDSIQFEVYQSQDGTGGWQKILDRGNGLDFTTTSGYDYLQVMGYIEGTAAVKTIGPGNGAYSYAQSTTPQIDDLRVSKDISPIDEFDAAIAEVSSMRADIGIIEQNAASTARMLLNQRIELSDVNSNWMDADVALEITELTRNSILSQSAASMIAAAGNLSAGRVSALLSNIF